MLAGDLTKQSIITAGPHFVHRIDPVLFQFMGIKLYYYGLAYALGFLGVHFWLQWRKVKLDWQAEEIYDLSILFAVCVLFFGRAFEIIFYEWGYYKHHLTQLLSYWRGGMASHGVLLGAVVAIWLFCQLRKRNFIQIADEVVIPAAFFLGLGRIGNFINGQIFGYVTDVWWAVKFPDAAGFRHPVTLYESFKNFLIVPILLFVRRKSYSGQGKLVAHFILWYGFLRLFTDYFREYGNTFLGIGTGQYFNFFMALSGLGLLIWFSRESCKCNATKTVSKNNIHPFSVKKRMDKIDQPFNKIRLNFKKVIFIILLLFCLTIPSSWTQGVLKEYRYRDNAQKTNVINIHKEIKH